MYITNDILNLTYHLETEHLPTPENSYLLMGCIDVLNNFGEMFKLPRSSYRSIRKLCGEHSIIKIAIHEASNKQ